MSCLPVSRPLTLVEIRVLGCLVEKELATPEYYPMTLNALVNACNQKSNRSPVVNFDQQTVAEALEALRPLGLATQSAEGGRRPNSATTFMASFVSTMQKWPSWPNSYCVGPKQVANYANEPVGCSRSTPWSRLKTFCTN